MTTRTGYAISPIPASAGVPGLNCARFQYTGALVNGDVIEFGNNYQANLPAGAILEDAQVFLSDSNSSVSLEAGYAAVDGASGTTNSVADVDATYFFSSTAMNTAGRYRANGTKAPLKLQRASYPTITVASGGLGSEAVVEIDVFYTFNDTDGLTVVQ